MGYTNYWTPKKVSAKKFKEFSDMCKKLHDNLPETTDIAGGYYADNVIKIGEGMGEGGKPEFTKDTVRFNGVGELSHETFSIVLNDNEWNFCKTARKPYDLLVCSCLLASAEILGYEISSDGNLDDWKPAIEFYNEVVGSNITDKDLAKFGIS